MNKDLIAIFEYLEKERGIKREIVIEAIRESLELSAQKSVHGADEVQVEIDPKTCVIEVYCTKHVVEKVTHPTLEISLNDAIQLKGDAALGDAIRVAITPKDFGRVAAQKARQVIGAKLRGAERDVVYDEYRHRIGTLISGSVKRIGRGNTLIVDLGKVEGIIPARNYPLTERYQIGDKIVALLAEVRDTEMGGAEVVLSRSHPDFVQQLFEQEIPEIDDGTISIVKIAREAGYRTKMIVSSSDQKVDPVGACIGMRGIRVKNITRELGGEKVDIIPYSSDMMTLLCSAFHPVEIRHVKVSEDGNSAVVVVDDEIFANAIGKKGFNVRLIGQLLGIQLDVQKISDYQKIQAIERANLAISDNPALDEPLTAIEGISPIIVDELVQQQEGLFNTARKVLSASLDELTKVPGVSSEMAEKILEQLRKGFLS